MNLSCRLHAPSLGHSSRRQRPGWWMGAMLGIYLMLSTNPVAVGQDSLPASNALASVPRNAVSVLGEVLPPASVGMPAPGFPIPQNAPGNRFQQGQEPLDAATVRRSIKLGISYLKEAQLRDGSWPRYSDYQGGVTALVTLAMLNAGEPVNSNTIQRALRVLEAIPRDRTYVVSLRTMALAAADPKGKRFKGIIQRDVDWLLKAQLKNGGWSYSDISKSPSGDGSNAQFALLALKEASDIGINVPQESWQRSKRYWLQLTRGDGGFGYGPGDGEGRGSMTCAGIASMIIINEQLFDPKQAANGEFARCCQPNTNDQVVEDAIQWLANNFTVRGNPNARGARSSKLYYLYALERAGRFSGRRFIGPHDWYRAGANELLKMQKGSGAWQGLRGIGEAQPAVATSFALLFLSKGKRPVAVGKYNHGAMDWDTHPRGIHYLTRTLEEEWGQKLNWQTVKAQDATVDDLFEAPVLFMSGRDVVGLQPQEKVALKKYIENGGFLFAEACQGDGCQPGRFEKAFQDLMAQLFPDSELQPLEANHPIWNAHFPLLPNAERPLSGLQACCRTAVVFCPKNLSCYWALGRKKILENNSVNPALRNRIRYCQQLGVNVIAYATGRELKEKGETPRLVENNIELLKDRSLVLPKLNHAGGSDDAPNAWKRVLEDVAQVSGLEINTSKKLIDPSAEQLADYPFVFMHGRNRFSFNDEQREAIRNYLKMGGFIFAESICSSEAFTESFRAEMKTILGPGALGPIPEDHEIWNDERYGPVLNNVRLRLKNAQGEFKETLVTPKMEGVVFKGRLAVIFSPFDLSCAMENTTVSNCDGYVRADALQIASNIIFYSLRSDANQ